MQTKDNNDAITINDLVMKIGEQAVVIMRLERIIAALQAHISKLEKERDKDQA